MAENPVLRATKPEQYSPLAETPEEVAKKAERVKESGNIAYKAGKYTEAIDLYTEAIALEDCQRAATLQRASPSPKTLLRLARCQLALGSTIAAAPTVRDILSIEPTNIQALQLREKIKTLEGHVKNFEAAKEKKKWGLAELALGECLRAINGEGSEIPAEWRIWRVELELARGNWGGANMAANNALRTNPDSPDILALRGLVLFLSGKLEQAKIHAQNALRLDPSCESARKLRERVKDVGQLWEDGNASFKAGKLQEALGKYTEALERIGDAEEEGKGGQIRAMLLSNRAITLFKLSKHEEALKDTNSSLDLSPNSFKALRTRARINLHLEDFDASITDFKSAIQQVQTESSATDADVRGLRAELKKAEAALKRSKTKDYYKILGVARDCNDSDIKKAYRRESLKHYPGNGGDEEKYRLVVEAYAVLSDSQRRAQYDMDEDEDGLNDRGGMGGGPGFSYTDLSETFAQFRGGGIGSLGGVDFDGPGGGFPGGGGFTSFGGGAGGAGGRNEREAGKRVNPAENFPTGIAPPPGAAVGSMNLAEIPTRNHEAEAQKVDVELPSQDPTTPVSPLSAEEPQGEAPDWSVNKEQTINTTSLEDHFPSTLRSEHMAPYIATMSAEQQEALEIAIAQKRMRLRLQKARKREVINAAVAM